MAAGRFAGAVHVMVVDERHTDRLGLLAQCVQQVREPRVIVGRDGAIFRLLVDDLQHLSTGVADELRVGQVQIDLCGDVLRLVLQVAAREHRERDPAGLQQGAQFGRLRAPTVHRACAELDALEPDSGDVGDCLGIVAAPGDGGVAEFDVRFRLKAETTGFERPCSFRLQAEPLGPCTFRLQAEPLGPCSFRLQAECCGQSGQRREKFASFEIRHATAPVPRCGGAAWRQPRCPPAQ